MKTFSITLFTFLIAFQFSLRAQNNQLIDSLVTAINKMPDDTAKVNAYKKLVQAAQDGKDVMVYAVKYLQLAEKLSDRKKKAEALSIVGQIYFQHNNDVKALEYFEKSLTIAEAIKDSEQIAEIFTAMSVVHNLHSEDSVQALEYANKSILIWEKLGKQEQLSGSLLLVGVIYFNRNNSVKAMEYYQRSLKISQAIHDQAAFANTLGVIGNIYIGNKEYGKAEMTCKQSLQIARELNDKQTIYNAAEYLFIIYQQQHRYKDALGMNILSNQMKDSLKNIETEKSVLKTQMQYEFEKKQLEQKAEQEKKDALSMAEISKQKLIRNSTFGGVGLAGVFSFFLVRSFSRKKKIFFEKQISDVEMKALRAQMNPHFIFNSLHSINKFMMDNDKENASEYLSKFSKLMRLILENSREPEVSLEKDLSALELYLQLESLRFQNKFRYSIDVDENIDQENTLVPPLMLQPFVENSIIHGISSKDNGVIQIKIRKEKEIIHCLVEDNGIGRKKAGTMFGTEKENTGSLAIRITQERISILNQLKKTKAVLTIFDLNDAANNPCGVRVELMLPQVNAF